MVPLGFYITWLGRMWTSPKWDLAAAKILRQYPRSSQDVNLSMTKIAADHPDKHVPLLLRQDRNPLNDSPVEIGRSIPPPGGVVEA